MLHDHIAGGRASNPRALFADPDVRILPGRTLCFPGRFCAATAPSLPFSATSSNTAIALPISCSTPGPRSYLRAGSCPASSTPVAGLFSGAAPDSNDSLPLCDPVSHRVPAHTAGPGNIRWSGRRLPRPFVLRSVRGAVVPLAAHEQRRREQVGTGDVQFEESRLRPLPVPSAV